MRNLLVFMLLFPQLVYANQADSSFFEVKDCYYFSDTRNFCFHESSVVEDGFWFDDRSFYEKAYPKIEGVNHAND